MSSSRASFQDQPYAGAYTLTGTGGVLREGAMRFVETLTNAAPVTVPTGADIAVDSGVTATLAGAIDGQGLLTKTGYGTLALAGTCATDVAVARGTLAIEDDLIDDDKALRVSMGATLDVADGVNETVALLSFSGRTGIVTVKGSTVLEGDTNGDCVVNILDMIGIRNHLNDEAASWPAFDVNNDTFINVLDMIYVRNRLNDMCQ